MKSTTGGDTEFRLRLSQVLSKFPSVATLARQIGVSDNAVYKWLAGRGQPSVSNLVSLSRTAGVSLEWLATGREPGADASGSPARAGARGAAALNVGGAAAHPDANDSPARDSVSGAATRASRSLERGGGSTPRAAGSGKRASASTAPTAGAGRTRRGDRVAPRAAAHAAGGAAAASPRARGRRPRGAGGDFDASGDRATRPDGATYAEYTFPSYGLSRGRNGAGGLARSEQVVDSLAFKTEWLRRRLLAAPRNLVLLEVVGDTMAPTLGDSDLILVDLGEPRFRQDGVYVLRRDGELEVKRLQRGPGGNLIIKSDNSAYESTVVTPDHVGIIGRVIWAAGRI
jgi:phage repressor protein C with HTH and peptisase S24 domain